MECSPIPARVIATCFALVAFAGAVTVGMAVDNPAYTVIYRALITMLVSWPVGYAVGLVAQRVNERSIQAYKQQHPIVDESAAEPPSAAAGEDSTTSANNATSTRVA